MAACSLRTCFPAIMDSCPRRDREIALLRPVSPLHPTSEATSSHEFRFLRRSETAARSGTPLCGCPGNARPHVVRRSLDGEEPYAAPLWREIANMGWIGAAIPEQYGGAGLGYEGLCVHRSRGNRPGRRPGAVRLDSVSCRRSNPARRHGGATTKIFASIGRRLADRLFRLGGRQRQPIAGRHSRPCDRGQTERREMAGCGRRDR